MNPVAPVRAMRGRWEVPTWVTAALGGFRACAGLITISHSAVLRWRDVVASIGYDPPRTVAASGCKGGCDVGRRHAALVPAGGGGAHLRGGGHPHHAGIAGTQMGLRAADRIYRSGRRVPLRARLPRAASRPARAIRGRALAPGAGLDHALRRR